MDKIKDYCAFIVQSNVNYLIFIAANVLYLVYALNAILNQSIINMNLKKMFDFLIARPLIRRRSVVKIVK
jgi:hypothetical protein